MRFMEYENDPGRKTVKVYRREREVIHVRVVAASEFDGVRITTFELKYPRFIHAEVMTHRMFSRNAMSSRAIPISKMIDNVLHDYAIPIRIGSNKPGMQDGGALSGWRESLAYNIWSGARYPAVMVAKILDTIGVHKQIANRVTEPWQRISVVITATEWSNFFRLRNHESAEPTIRALAMAMEQAMEGSEYSKTRLHLPYVLYRETEKYDLSTLMMISSARCARVSYMRHGTNKIDIDNDIALYKRLAHREPGDDEPQHLSPLEHPAVYIGSGWYANYRGWYSFRKAVEDGVSVSKLIFSRTA